MSGLYPLGSNVQVSYQDDAITSQNPGFGYGGTETGALWFEDREIAGTLYRAQNATWNKFSQSWLLVDSTKPAYAFSVSNGVQSVLYSPSGTTPFTSWQTLWTIGDGGVNGNGVYNILSYGAKGDGVTDDSGAFTSMLSAIAASAYPKVAVYIPPLTYNIAAAIAGSWSKVAEVHADGAVFTGAFIPYTLGSPLAIGVEGQNFGSYGLSTNNTTYLRPIFGIRATDSSPASTNALAQGDAGMLPALRVEVTATGSGQPNPIYGYVFGQSTTADSGFSKSNLVGAMIGGELDASDTHSGIWGMNSLASSKRASPDYQMFGFESNVFNDGLDCGSGLPQATWAKIGISSTSSGFYPIHYGLLATYSSGTTAQSPTNGNRPHIGVHISDAIDYGICIGDTSSTSPTQGAALKMAVGARFSEGGVATGTSGNNTNYGSVNLGFYLNVNTGTTTSAEHAFFLSAQPGATTGANPAEQLQVQYNSGGAVILTLDSTGDLAVNGTVGTGGSTGPYWKSGTGAPAYTAPKGSMYSRTDGAVGTTLYVTQGGGTWNPVSGV